MKQRVGKGALTAKEVQALKPDPERRLEIPAGIIRGLYLVVQPSGAKSWCLRYRFRGRTRKLTLGTHPPLSLAEARRMGGDALGRAQKGEDPAREEEKPAATTFAQAVDEFIERWCKPNNRTWPEVRRLLKAPVEKWGTRAVVGIGRVDIVRLLDGIADRAPIVANRTRTRLLRFFGWCVERGILDQSPMAGVRRPVREESRDRVLSDPELAEIWQATGGLGFPNGAYFRLLILTGQRRAEVATMRWADVSFDEELWTLPKGSTKANRQHFVPLAPTTLELLQTIPRFTGPYILTTSGGAKPISGYSKAKRRIDAAIIAARREAGCQAPMFEWRVHDLRRTMATTLAGLSVPPHVLGALLSHSPGRTMGITAIYNRFRYTDECRRALEAWEQHVLKLERQGARVRKAG